jgi:hypothetical protein
VIEVAPGARIAGTVGPLASFLALDPEYDPNARPGIYRHQRGYGPTITVVSGRFRREGIRLDHRGRFAIEGLPPGPVQLSLHAFTKGERGGRGRDPLPYDLGAHVVAHGKPLEVALEVPPR